MYHIVFHAYRPPKYLRLPSPATYGKPRRNRKGRMSDSEIMTILVRCHFGTYRNLTPNHQTA